MVRRTLFLRVSLGVATLLACSAEPLCADCVGYLLRDQLKRHEVDVVVSGRVTQIRDVLSDPAVQHVTLQVDRVWKGNPGRTFEVYNMPTRWEKTIVVRTPGGEGGVGGTPTGYQPFQADESYVVVARRLTPLERSELSVGADAEGYGTAYCRDGSRTLAEAEINREFAHIGAGRKVR